MFVRSEMNEGDLNPEVQIELEKLNTSSAQINELENKLQLLRNIYYESLSKFTVHLTDVSNKVGSAVPRARPYYELKRQQLEMQKESQLAAVKFECACIQLNQANDVLSKAEASAKQSSKLDDSAMELLNIAISKVNQARKEKEEAHMEHETYLNLYMDLENKIQQMLKKHKNDIKRSKVYFNSSKLMEEKLKEDKLKIEVYEEKVKICKDIYNKALVTLESISNRIHLERKTKELLGPRGEGVGAEAEESECHETGDTETKSSATDYQSISDLNESIKSRSHKYASLNLNSKRRSTMSSATPIVENLLKVASANNCELFLQDKMYKRTSSYNSQ